MTSVAESLLNRYPNISDGELDTLIEIFPKLPIIDVSLMTADDRLSEKVAEFHQDHRARLGTSKAELVLLVLALLIFPASITAFIFSSLN